MKHVAARSVRPYDDRQKGSQFEPMPRKRTQHDRIILKMPKVDQEKRGLKKERKERRILCPKYRQSKHALSKEGIVKGTVPVSAASGQNARRA